MSGTKNLSKKPSTPHSMSGRNAATEGGMEAFLGRHQFLIYRLFSLSGLVPVGAFLAVHLATNASVLAGPEVFQSRVDMIHSLGPLLPAVELLFIFLPILFHAAVGFVIVAGGLPNVGSYPYVGNLRYTLQRATGMIAFAFIVWHVWQLHVIGRPFGGGAFDPHQASSTAATAIRPILVSILYAIGVLSAVFHFANGLWTLGITWGVWTSPAAMRRANWLSVIVGGLLAIAGLGGLVGIRSVDVTAARAVEERLDKAKRLLEGEAPLDRDSSSPIHPAVDRGAGNRVDARANEKMTPSQ